ncbi:MAG: addiction module protein [Opitutae bacterium]|nr:addiction module protein [Opitutae bacterium]
MTTAHLTESVLALPEAERLALAREIIASLSNDEGQKAAINEGVRRMEAIITGQTAGLTESQFRQALE